jgi:hypothetical protein
MANEKLGGMGAASVDLWEHSDSALLRGLHAPHPGIAEGQVYV